MSTLHAVTIATSNDYKAKTKWGCTCGEARTAGNLHYAGAEASQHLRAVEEDEWEGVGS